MIRFSLIVIIQSLFSLNILAQSLKPAWLVNIDAYNDCDMADIEVDKEGNTYAAFNYQGSLSIKEIKKNLDYGHHMHGGIVKISPSGKVRWAISFKSANDNRIRSISLSPEGDLLVTGFGDGLMRFPAGKDSIVVGRAKNKNEYHQPQGIYLAKINPEGATKWVRFLSTSWGEGLDVSANSKNEIAWIYYHRSSIKENGMLIDSLINKHDHSRTSIAYLNENGIIQRIQKINESANNSYTVGAHVKYDPEDNLYVYGKFNGKIKFTENDSLTNDNYHESIDSYLAKFNTQGAFEWSKKIGGRNAQILEDITFGEDLSVYATGLYSYECTIGNGMKLEEKSEYQWKSGNSFFHFRCYTDGELEFTRYYNTDKYNSSFSGNSIAIDTYNNIHILGSFTDSVKIDGFQLARNHYTAHTYYSRWKGNKVNDIFEIGETPEGWISPNSIQINGNYFAIGGGYYGKQNSIEIKGLKQKLSSLDYGRASYIIGGLIPLQKPLLEQQLTAMQKRKIYLNELEPLLVCIKPQVNETPAANRWIPEDTSKVNGRSQLGFEPCGVILNEKSAKVYPNPTQGAASIELSGMIGGSTRIDVFSENGQLLLSKAIEIQEPVFTLAINLSDVTPGINFVRIIHGGYEKALRIVKVN